MVERWKRRLWRYMLPMLCVCLLMVGHAAATELPQRPDGDRTALQEFWVRAQTMPWFNDVGLLDVRHQFWYTAAGALLALWIVDDMLRRWPVRSRRAWGGIVLALGGLLWLAGWGWTQTTGWQGQLFLPPHHTVGLGPAQIPTVAFSEFVVPPAPDGPGRSLTMRVQVNGEPTTMSEQRPITVQGWHLRPRWYGGVVTLPDGRSLYFGGDGTQTAVVGGEAVQITLDVETLRVETVPSVPASVERYAIIAARFDPGAPIRRLGLIVVLLGSVLSLGEWIKQSNEQTFISLPPVI